MLSETVLNVKLATKVLPYHVYGKFGTDYKVSKDWQTGIEHDCGLEESQHMQMLLSV